MADNKNIKKISTVADFLQWVRKNQRHDERSTLYRGLANADWGVEAGSYRRLRKSISRKKPQKDSQEGPFQVLFSEDNKKLLQKVRMEKYRTEGSDLELFAKLQHDGVLNCLMDFTIQPLIALWFACQPSLDENKSGKVAAIDEQQYMPITSEDMEEIRGFPRPKNKKPKLWIWKPPGQIKNLIITQHLVFVLGAPKISINESDSCIVEEKNKKKILEELQNMGISAETLFRYYAGFILLNKHDDVWCYNQAIKLYPEYASIYNDRGLAKSALGRYEEAIADYDEAIRRDSKNAEAYYNRGVAKSALGCFEEAMVDCDKAIALAPKDAQTYSNRGEVKYRQGRYEEAILDYDKAIALAPENAEIYYDRGLANSELERYKEAKLDFSKAISLAPENAEIYYNRGLVNSDLEHYEEAKLDFSKAISLVPEDAEIYYSRGLVNSELEYYEEAMVDYDKVIDLSPGDGQAHGERGGVRCRLGRYEEAIADFDEAICYNSANVVAYYNRCLSKIKVGDIEGALTDHRKAKELAPDDERIIALEKLKEYLKSIEDEQIKDEPISLF